MERLSGDDDSEDDAKLDEQRKSARCKARSSGILSRGIKTNAHTRSESPENLSRTERSNHEVCAGESTLISERFQQPVLPVNWFSWIAHISAPQLDSREKRSEPNADGRATTRRTQLDSIRSTHLNAIRRHRRSGLQPALE